MRHKMLWEWMNISVVQIRVFCPIMKSKERTTSGMNTGHTQSVLCSLWPVSLHQFTEEEKLLWMTRWVWWYCVCDARIPEIESDIFLLIQLNREQKTKPNYDTLFCGLFMFCKMVSSWPNHDCKRNTVP